MDFFMRNAVDNFAIVSDQLSDHRRRLCACRSLQDTAPPNFVGTTDRFVRMRVKVHVKETSSTALHLFGAQTRKFHRDVSPPPHTAC